MNQSVKTPIQHPNRLVPQVVLGILIGFDARNQPLVAFADNPQSAALPACFSFPLTHEYIGSKVALVFVEGDYSKPMIIGPVKDSLKRSKPVPATPLEISLDNQEKLTVTAQQELTLKCGDASITLTRDGKIRLRGKYISSSASGMQTIKGGSVQIN